MYAPLLKHLHFDSTLSYADSSYFFSLPKKVTKKR